MLVITYNKIVKAVAEMYDKIGCEVDSDVCPALENARVIEDNPTANFALKIMVDNLKIAKEKHIPACQDTGMATLFVEVGRDLHIGCNITQAINKGVREGYDKLFRKSVLDPLTRINTTDNTPAVIHYDIIEGSRLKISAMAKGFGSENMSKLYMLTPADGVEGIINAVTETVRISGGCACPPVIVGVGIGGTMEKACIIAKKALLRKLGARNAASNIASLEIEMLNRINQLGVGAQGLGGIITALDVFVETFPTHLAGLPVAVNIQCHCSRHISITLLGDEL